MLDLSSHWNTNADGGLANPPLRRRSSASANRPRGRGGLPGEDHCGPRRPATWGRASDRDESGQAANVAKFACWAPVYVDLELTGQATDPSELVIEAADPDEIMTTLVVPLNLTSLTGKFAAADLGTIGYVRPAGVGEVTITVRGANGGKPLAEPFRVRSLRPRDPLTYVVLSLGGPLSGFDLPKPTGGIQDASAALRGGRVEPTSITDVAQLPDQWFGYDAADVVVLQTGPGTTSSCENFRRLDLGGGEAKQAALTSGARGGRSWSRSAGTPGWSRMPATRSSAVRGERDNSEPRAGYARPVLGRAESSQTSTFSAHLRSKARRSRSRTWWRRLAARPAC